MLEIKDLVRCDVTAKCMSAVTRGGIDNVLRLEFDGRLTGDFFRTRVITVNLLREH